MLKTSAAIVLLFVGLSLGGCCTSRGGHAGAKWEYRTLVVPNDAVPVEQPGKGWTSDDAVLNSMIRDGWIVAGYGIDHVNSQWFLLKRHKRNP